MGFELCYSFHEKAEEGYNKEETKTKKKKIGEPFEEVPLERLASEIIKLMARRDIFVFDFKIVELARKEISFKETKGGIVIKNKKFLFDDDSQIIVHEIDETPSTTLAVAGQGQASIPTMAPAQPHNQGQRRPVKFMVFQPELPMMTEIRNKGIRFTPDKRYPVFKIQQSPTGVGEVFTMIDDTGREQLISDKYFIPADTVFVGAEAGFQDSSPTQAQRDGGKLYWGNTLHEPDMPNIRR